MWCSVVWCSYNELTNCLLTNRLHGKAAEICLANDYDYKIHEYINSTHNTFLSCGIGKLSCGVGKVLLGSHNQKPLTTY